MSDPGASTDTLLVWLAILGISLSTVVTRGSFLVLGARLKLPAIVDHALSYAPACALAAIMVPDLAFVQGTLRLDSTNPRLLAALVAALVFAVSRSFLATLVCGMVAFTALRLWL